jgi:triacylglycerol lipase
MARTAPEPFELHSAPLERPVADLSLLERSLLFAELSKIAYLNEEYAEPYVKQLGFEEDVFLEADGAQAYVFSDGLDRVIVCRGTEPNDWNDIRADARTSMVLAETVGRVHRGFKREVDDLWPQLDDYLADNTLTLWFTGHSLGGAMATLCAGRCFLSNIASNPRAIYSFGSPRVGDRQYIHYVAIEHIRWVNNNDIITRSPPAWMRYRHSGQEIYIDHKGRVHRRISPRQKAEDRSRGLWEALRKRRIDYLADHAVDDYIAHIFAATQRPPAAPRPRPFRARRPRPG